MKHPPERPLIIHADSREPHPHTRDLHMPPGAQVARCKVCGGRRACEPVREPWSVKGHERVYYPTERVTLREGDYSVPGLALWKPLDDDGPWRGKPLAVIEYKTVGDAISTVVGTVEDGLGAAVSNRERFEAELARMRAYAWRAIVIAGTMGDIQLEAAREGRRFNAASVLGSYAIFSARFGVQVMYAGNQAGAEWYIGTMLSRIWSEHTGGAQWRKARDRGELAALPWAQGHREALAAGGDPVATPEVTT